MRKDYLNMHVFQYKNWCNPKSDRWFFFQLWLSEELFIGRILSEKNLGDTGLISEETEVLFAQLNKRAEAATGIDSVAGDSLQYIDSVPVTRNHRNIQLK